MLLPGAQDDIAAVSRFLRVASKRDPEGPVPRTDRGGESQKGLTKMRPVGWKDHESPSIRRRVSHPGIRTRTYQVLRESPSQFPIGSL